MPLGEPSDGYPDSIKPCLRALQEFDDTMEVEGLSQLSRFSVSMIDNIPECLSIHLSRSCQSQESSVVEGSFGPDESPAGDVDLTGPYMADVSMTQDEAPEQQETVMLGNSEQFDQSTPSINSSEAAQSPSTPTRTVVTRPVVSTAPDGHGLTERRLSSYLPKPDFTKGSSQGPEPLRTPSGHFTFQLAEKEANSVAYEMDTTPTQRLLSQSSNPVISKSLTFNLETKPEEAAQAIKHRHDEDATDESPLETDGTSDNSIEQQPRSRPGPAGIKTKKRKLTQQPCELHKRLGNALSSLLNLL